MRKPSGRLAKNFARVLPAPCGVNVTELRTRRSFVRPTILYAAFCCPDVRRAAALLCFSCALCSRPRAFCLRFFVTRAVRQNEPISHFFYRPSQLQFWDYGQDGKRALVSLHGALDQLAIGLVVRISTAITSTPRFAGPRTAQAPGDLQVGGCPRPLALDIMTTSHAPDRPLVGGASCCITRRVSAAGKNCLHRRNGSRGHPCRAALNACAIG